MMFPHNAVILERGKFRLEIRSMEAFGAVAKKSPDDVKVIYSQQQYWQDRKKQFKLELDYDWTYQSAYTGSVLNASDIPTDQRINYDRLKVSSVSEVCFYDENVLFDDEMGDNGTSVFSVKTVRSRFCVCLNRAVESDEIWNLRPCSVFHSRG